MTMPGMAQQIRVSPVRKTVLQHCGWVATLGTPQPWQCPGCGTILNADPPPS